MTKRRVGKRFSAAARAEAAARRKQGRPAWVKGKRRASLHGRQQKEKKGHGDGG